MQICNCRITYENRREIIPIIIYEIYDYFNLHH